MIFTRVMFFTMASVIAVLFYSQFPPNRRR